MEEDPTWSQHSIDVVDGPSDIPRVQTIQGSLLHYAISLEIRPLLGDVYSFPFDASLQVPFFALLLVDECPTEIGSDQILITPLIQRIQHGALPTS